MNTKSKAFNRVATNLGLDETESEKAYEWFKLGQDDANGNLKQRAALLHRSIDRLTVADNQLSQSEINFLVQGLGGLVTDLHQQREELKAFEMFAFELSDKDRPDETADAFKDLNRVKECLRENKIYRKRLGGMIRKLKKQR